MSSIDKKVGIASWSTFESNLSTVTTCLQLKDIHVRLVSTLRFVYEICHSVFSELVKNDTLSLDRESCIRSSCLALHLGQKTFDLKFLDFDLQMYFA